LTDQVRCSAGARREDNAGDRGNGQQNHRGAGMTRGERTTGGRATTGHCPPKYPDSSRTSELISAYFDQVS
jgi:hypothetical protein